MSKNRFIKRNVLKAIAAGVLALSFGATASAEIITEKIADLGGDYAAAKSTWTTGTSQGSGSKAENIATLGGVGTWSYLQNNTKAPLVYVNTNPEYKGIDGKTNIFAGTAQYVSTSNEQIFSSDTETNRYANQSSLNVLNIHGNSIDVGVSYVWNSDFTGAIDLTAFAQHARKSGNGCKYTLEYYSDETATPVTLHNSGSLISSNSTIAQDLYNQSGYINVTDKSRIVMTVTNAGSANCNASYAGLEINRVTNDTGESITANLASSFETGTAGQKMSANGWSYWVSKAANIEATGSNAAELLWQTNVGNGGNAGYSGGATSGDNSNKTPAVSNKKIFGDSADFEGTTHLEIHPAQSNDFDYTVLSWDCSEFGGRLFDISGDIKSQGNSGQISWNSVEFSILADGEEVYKLRPTVTTYASIPFTNFDLSNIYAASSIDFVINSLGQYNGDSTILGINISSNVPEPSSWALLVLGAVGLAYWRKRR